MDKQGTMENKETKITYNEYLMAVKLYEVAEKGLEELIEKICETEKNIILEDNGITDITKEEDKFLYELCNSIQEKLCVAKAEINEVCAEKL